MTVHVTADPILPFTSIGDEKNSNMKGTEDIDSAELEETIQSNLSDSGTEDDDSVCRFDRKSASYGSARRFFNKSSAKAWKINRRSTFDDTSNEYFTLVFDDENKEIENAEKVLAKKGKSLKEAIEVLFLEHSKDISAHSVFLESSKTPLPLAFDTFPLAGNVLYVKENAEMEIDERIITLMKSAEDEKKVQNQRPKKNIMPSIFNDSVEMVTPTSKQSSVRKSGVSTGLTKDGNGSLSELLNTYAFNSFDTDNDFDGPETYLNSAGLEESWTDIITEIEGMTDKDKIQQEAIWELLTTELNYLCKIRVIIMFKNCLVSSQKENFLEEIEIDKVFSNIEEVYDTNRKFWQNHLRHVTEEARATKRPIKPSQLKESFESFGELFKPYIKYCLEEGSCVKYLKQLKRENEMFREYLVWCENLQQCMRLKLADLLVKPMQRVTKYSLLLKAILGKTIKEDERDVLENMILKVDTFVTKINSTLRLRNERQKLEAVLERIDTYNPIEAASEELEKLLERHYCNFDLHGVIPGLHEEEQRCILFEGQLKMVEKQGRSDVHVFLFTDVLVFAKMKKGSDKFRIIRQPFRLNKIRIHPSKDAIHTSKDVGAFNIVYLNEYHVVVAAFTLLCTGNNEHLKWISAIEKAKKRYEDAQAARGSTLAFLDDDMSPVSTLPMSFSSSPSPMPDRHSIVSDDNRSIDQSSVVREDLHSSTEAVIRSNQKLRDVSENHVKRSFSDSKPGVTYSERSSSKQKSTVRPKSLVNMSDHNDIVKWMLTNENRMQSGSLMSDISDDSQRSSGIGDSFRSTNSDGIMMSNLPELSKVAQLKARFEINGCDSPVNTEGSDSSILSTPECQRTSQPDYIDNDPNRKEEGPVQSTGNIVMHDIDKDTENDDSESLTLSSTLRSSNRSYDNASNRQFKLLYVSTASQTDNSMSVYGLGSVGLHVMDSSVQCDLQSPDLQSKNLNDDLAVESISECSNSSTLNSDVTKEMLKSANVPGNSLSSYISENLEEAATTENTLNVSVSENIMSCNLSENVTNGNLAVSLTDIDFSVNLTSIELSENSETISLTECISITKATSLNDVGTQYEVPCDTMKDMSTQCDSLLQFPAMEDEQCVADGIQTPTKPRTEAWDLNANICCKSKPSCQFQKSTSFDGSRTKSIKYSDSVPNIGILLKESIYFIRSKSEELQQNSCPNSPLSCTSSFRQLPGMHALQILSESLEAIIQNRLNILSKSKQSPAKDCDDCSIKLDMPDKDQSNFNSKFYVQCNSNSSASLRKLAILNNSPLSPRRELKQPDFKQEEEEEEDEIDSFDEDMDEPTSQSSPKERADSKRFTWHTFDSSEALKRIEQTKTDYPIAVDSASLYSNQSLSRSTEMINSPKKSSFKKSIIKKFGGVLNRSDDSRSNIDNSNTTTDSLDVKSLQKMQKKERKRTKKEKRVKEKVEKKQREIVKSRGRSMSTSFSHVDIPLSTSVDSPTSSVNSR